jgi:hypothetical protein
MKALVFACLAALLASGCASQSRISDADKLQLYRAHAGAPVPNFQYYGRLDGWTPLGETALAVWTKPSEVYLLELKGTCQDLDFAQAITVTNQFGRVYQNFDKVIVLGQGANQIPCWIKEIRPVDAKALKQAESEKRAAQVAEREKA